MKKKPNSYLTIQESADLLGVTRQAIYAAVKSGKLAVNYYRGKACIGLIQLSQYEAHKYGRKHRRFEGAPTYAEGELSVNETARFLGCTEQQVYYQVRIGRIPAARKGAAIIVKREDLERLFAAPIKKDLTA